MMAISTPGCRSQRVEGRRDLGAGGPEPVIAVAAHTDPEGRQGDQQPDVPPDLLSQAGHRRIEGGADCDAGLVLIRPGPPG